MEVSSQTLQTKTPKKRIFALIISAFFILTAYFTAQQYYTNLDEAKELTLKRLQSTANLLAPQIDGDGLLKLMQDFDKRDTSTLLTENETYAKIHNLLRQSTQTASIKTPITIVVRDSATQSFLFAVTSSKKPLFRRPYITIPPAMITNFEKGGALDIYKDEFGTWLSAFAPIKNKEGNSVAAVLVDEKFDNFILSIQQRTIRNGAIGLVFFLVLVLVLIKILKEILANEQKVRDELSQAYLDRKDLSEKLSINEMKMKEYAEHLEKSNQELTDFANIASHDLKAPIRGILSFAQLYERRNKQKFDDRDTEYFDFIKTNANQSLRLIEGLLSYSKVDKNLGEPVEVLVAEAVESAQSNLMSVIKERNAKVIADNLPVIQGNMMLITQLFQNLINNGIKYNKSEQPTIIVSANCNQSGDCIFSVKDNGIGIEEKYQHDVFGMFRRLHSSAEYEGSGIGLAFCNRIVETYGGKMWLESKVGEGSTFYFTLPKATVITEAKQERINS